MGSILDNLPKLALVGLATTTAFVQASTGQSDIAVEYKYELPKKRNSLGSNYVSQRYGLSSNVEITTYKSEVLKFIGDDEALRALLNTTVLSLQEHYTVFGSSINLLEDPNEDYSQIHICIYSVDEDKFEKYISFIDSWIETVPNNYLDKIVVTVA